MSNSPNFFYDPRSRRYRSASTGRYLTNEQVRGAVDSIIVTQASEFRGVAQSLVDGRITMAEFQLQMHNKLKSLHVAMALAGNGGAKNTSAGDLGFVGSLLKAQYGFLRDMAVQIKRGHQPLDRTLLSRCELYAQAARHSHEQMRERAARFSGMQQARSLLGVADHCSGCVSEAKKGWVAIGALIPIGERICKTRCHCTISYR